jgi:hypothetical protein
MAKYLRKTTYEEEKFILAHSFGSFSHGQLTALLSVL